MDGTIATIVSVCALLAGVAAIGWLSKLSKRMTGLGKRLLESEDVGKIMEAAKKAASYDSRMVGCESTANQNQKQLEEHKTKLSELAAGAEAIEQTVSRNTAGLAEVSQKAASFESNMAEYESKTQQSQNQLMQLETKIDELITRLGAVEQTLNEHTSTLERSGQSTRALENEVRCLEEFKTTTEKVHSSILAAFSDMKVSEPAEAMPEITPEPAEPKPEDSGQQPQWGQWGQQDIS